ncbi:ATP-binding protein [Candidatus Parcubacteria bacterium]|nr:ATP-binding protein [Candidatus Parcubacteria bacterium]
MSKNNNWYVITGAPHSGKTSVVELLEEKGYRVVYEAARIYIDQEIKKGRTIKEIRKNELEFQKGILDLKIDVEKNLPKDEVIFFDRAIPDSDAYYELCGLSFDKCLKKAISKCEYKKVFLFEFLPYKKDYARTESEEDQEKLQELLEKSYKKLKAPLVKVPKMKSKEDRLEFVLDNL